MKHQPLIADAVKLVLRMPPELHERAVSSAAAEYISLNSYIVRAVATYLRNHPAPEL